MLVGIRGQKRLPLALLLGQSGNVRIRGLLDRADRILQRVRPASRIERQAPLAGDLVPVAVLERSGELPVISFEGRPRCVRYLVAHQLAAGADE